MQNCSARVLPESIPSVVALGLSFVLGFPGNIAALVVLLRRLKKDNMTMRLMLSLATSDLITLLPVPFCIWELLNGWTFGNVTCKLLYYVKYWAAYCSGLCLTLLSMQRYMQVLHPQQCAKLGPRRRNLIFCGMWLLSGLLSLYVPIQREVGCEYGGVSYCNRHYRNDAERLVTALIEITFIVSLISALVYFYYRLHRGVNETPFFSSNRVANLVTRIVAVFFILSVGVLITNILDIVAVSINSKSLLRTAELGGGITRSLIGVNSGVNPFLYTFSLRKEQNRHAALKNKFNQACLSRAPAKEKEKRGASIRRTIMSIKDGLNQAENPTLSKTNDTNISVNTLAVISTEIEGCEAQTQGTETVKDLTCRMELGLTETMFG